MNKKRKIPWFWRRRIACPDCGLIEKDEEFTFILRKEGQFKCPRCGALYSEQEFLEENWFKNRWDADLSDCG
jgi:uncharacterized C2H2 Zn-finger protein